jgi:hypothetical protein
MFDMRLGRWQQAIGEIASVVAMAIALFACGGGGGGGGSSSPPAPPNLTSAPGAAAMDAYFQGAHSVTLSASYGGSLYTVTDTTTPNTQPLAVFNMSPSPNSSETLTISKNGTAISTTTSTLVYMTSPMFVIIGSVGTVPGSYEFINQYQSIQPTIAVGQNLPLMSGFIYHDLAGTTVDATVAVNSTVESDSPTTVAFCTDAVVTAVANNPDNVANSSQTNCYRIDANGKTTLFKVIVVVAGVTLTFQ